MGCSMGASQGRSLACCAAKYTVCLLVPDCNKLRVLAAERQVHPYICGCGNSLGQPVGYTHRTLG
jgi:hypothetical protein